MGRTNKAPRGSERDLLMRVLTKWSETGIDTLRGSVGSRVLDNFNSWDLNRIRTVANEPLPFSLSGQDYWIKGEATPGEPPLFPVASVSMREEGDGSTGLTIRVALFGESPHEAFQFMLQGWRFESPEVDRTDPETGKPILSPRPFPHAQPTLGWYQNAKCMAHPHTSKGNAQICEDEHWSEEISFWRDLTNESQPGFPLRGDSLAGQALALLVTLYGAPRARGIVEKDEELSRRVNTSAEFRYILGLHPDH